MNDAVIGLDAVTMVVSGKCPKQIEQRVEKRNKQGQLYLRVDKTKQRDTYNVTIVLPSIIRPTNIRGFSLLDSVKLEYVIDVVKQDLQEILGTNNLEQLIVKKLEINANKSVPSRVNADAITELMARALLKPDAQQIEHCHGVNIHEARTIKTKVIDGFKTARDSTGRYQCKFYRKDRQLDLENKINPTIRMELVYNAKGVSQALGKKGKGISVLTDILQQSAMQKLILRYVLDVRASIMPAIRLYLEDATNLVLNDLKAGNGAYKTFLKRYDIIKYDYRIFRVAMFKFYKLVGNTKQSASVQCSRIKARAIEEALKADGYTDSNDLIMLRKQMKEQVQELKQTLTTKREEIAKKQDSLKKERYSESIDTLTQVNAEADKILLELLLQLSKDNVKNKVIISDMMKRQDRATSIAIIKLSQMPVYEGLITPRMKENLLVLSKSDAEIKWQEKQDSRAVEVGKELADVTMKRFMLDKAETVIFPKENVMFD